MNCKVILPFILIFIFSACSITSQQPPQTKLVQLPINYDLFPQAKTTQLNEQSIFTLTLDQQKEFLGRFDKKIAKGLKGHKALSELLNERMANFTYYGETYNASNAMRFNKGNCMSLAVLTTAYAKLLGLDFSYRVVHTLPIFSKKEDVILSSSHVQTIIYDPTFVADDKFYYFSTPKVVIDYFPSEGNRRGKTYSYETFIAMYYKNIAADALADRDLTKSFLYANTAYEYDSRNIETINLLAVIHRRAGDLKTAEAIYKTGLEMGKPSIALLSNYIMLLKSQQRIEEVTALQSKMDQLDNPNPYQALGRAYTARKDGDIEQAEIYFKKALKKAPYLNQAYMGLYKIYAKQQKLDKAQAMLIKALEWTYELDERKLYEHKLYSLKQNIAGHS
jgi:tetratricopeptide (TPR) repeat protein